MTDDPIRRFEPAIERIGRELLWEVDRREEEIGVGGSWEDNILEWGLGDPERKTRLLQFIDVYPTLKTDAQIIDHLKQYFPESSDRLPLALRVGLRATGGLLTSRLAAGAVQTVMKQMARRFIGGETIEEAAQCLKRLRAENLGASLDVLGEETLSETKADQNAAFLMSLMRDLDRPADALLNLSIKCSSLTSYFDPIDPDEVRRRLVPRLRRLLRESAAQNVFLQFDAEPYETCDLVLDTLLAIFDEPEFQSHPNVGVVLQAYLRDAENRVRRVVDWCRARHRPLTVRLVKGAYWDSEVIRARQEGWTPPVYLNKRETDACFERCLQDLMTADVDVRVAVASHNLRSVAAALALAEESAGRAARLEFQFLYGMARATRGVLAARGFPVRVYTPIGKLIPGMAYLVRRLLENTSNQSFLVQRRLGRLPAEDLMKSPHVSGSPGPAEPAPPAADGFHNAPAMQFHQFSVREKMREAVARRLASAAERIGPIFGAGRHAPEDGGPRMTSVNPSHPSHVIADVRMATTADVDGAVASARKAWALWRKTSARDRARILEHAAITLMSRHDEFTALIVCEAGKPWAEASADVGEAVDYLIYYSNEALRLESAAHYQPHVSGEVNTGSYRPRGVVAVISPWNFPLAIPAGQTTAALAAGNAVLFKPAEQTPAIAFHWVNLLLDAGVPPGVIQYLPGRGEDVGADLVRHPGVDVIAFTGSRAVGEQIIREAANAGQSPSGPKKVIAEMGGKNAVIIDSDADLDVAVAACLRSAFDYAGQKCSALSRLILLEDVFDSFMKRFIAAARHYPRGFSEMPSTRISPLIDADAQMRVKDYFNVASREGRWRLEPDPASVPSEGFFVPPAVVAVSDSNARVAQEEIFGPLLVAIPARSLDAAIAIANGTAYALTGGFFSRHPGHIEQVRREFDVGNLYINRPITGAVVCRQPFGGHRASGVGSKAGGPDYLAQFCIPVTISESLTRHGFSPDVAM